MDLNAYTDNIYDKIIEQIQDTRKAKNITQKKLAEDLGISPVTYSDMENGKTKFSVVRLIAVLKYLQIDNIYIFRSESLPTFSVTEYTTLLKNQLNTVDQVSSRVSKLKEENYQQAIHIQKLENENIEIKALLQEVLQKLEDKL